MWSALSAFRWNNEAKEGSWLLAAVQTFNCNGSPYILCLWKGWCSPFHFNPFSQLTSFRYRSPFQIQSLRCAWSVAAVIVVRFPLSNEYLCLYLSESFGAGTPVGGGGGRTQVSSPLRPLVLCQPLHLSQGVHTELYWPWKWYSRARSWPSGTSWESLAALSAVWLTAANPHS